MILKSHKEQKSHDLSGHEGHNHDYDRGNYIPSIVNNQGHALI